MGLETVNPRVLPKLNKRFTLEQFAAAAAFLKREGVSLRAFVLVQPPFSDKTEAVSWAVRSARFAFDCGAAVVSLIPTRPGNGALDALALAGEFSPPRLQTLEQALDQCLELQGGRVFADTWDLERFSCCTACFQSRKQRLEAINLHQRTRARVACRHCESN